MPPITSERPIPPLLNKITFYLISFPESNTGTQYLAARQSHLSIVSLDTLFFQVTQTGTRLNPMKAFSPICPHKTQLDRVVLYLILVGCVTSGLVQASDDLQTQFIQERTSILADRQQLRNKGSIEEIRLWDTQNEKRLRAQIELRRALAAQLEQEKPQMIGVIDIPGDASTDLEKALVQRAMTRNEWRLFRYEIRNLPPAAASAAMAEWQLRQEPKLAELRALQQVIVEESGQNAVVHRTTAPPDSASPAAKAFSQARNAYFVELQKALSSAGADDSSRLSGDWLSQCKALEEQMKALADQAAQEHVAKP
jgi:hypothetical protein